MELSLGRVKIRVSFAFSVMLSLLLGFGDAIGFGISFLSCCIHELLHLLLFVLFGAVPQSITLTCGGMRMNFGTSISVSFLRETVASIVPPLINALLGAVFTLLYSHGFSFFLVPAAANIVLGVVNLIPVRSLDGGRALWYIVAYSFSVQTADRLTGIIELCLIPLLLIVFVYAIIAIPGNISIPVLCIYVIMMIISKNNRFRA